MRGKELEAAPAGRAAAAAAREGAEPAAPLCGGACPDEAVEGPSGGTSSEAPHGPGDDSRWPLHRFPQPVDPATLPARFTCPFCYTPHPLCIAAASCVQEYLATCRAWSDELAAGKMFGVLVVLAAARVHALMPWLLSFAAGAMLYVVAEELLPRAGSRRGTCGFLVGFLFMMVLDVALG